MICSIHSNQKKLQGGRCPSCYSADWRKNNPDKIKAHLKTRKLKEHNSLDFKFKRRNSSLLRAYGITDLEFQEILKSQNGVCAICLNPPKNKKLHTDHCHITGRIRGILCHRCNWYLGAVDKDSELLVRLSLYGKSKLPWTDKIIKMQLAAGKIKW